MQGKELRAASARKEPTAGRQPAVRLPRRAQRSGGHGFGTRRRHLIKLGINPGEVCHASRSRKG